MSSPAVRLLRRQILSRAPPPLRHASPWTRRHFATHRETPASSLLSHSPGPYSNSAGGTSSRVDTLGPFPLGIRPNVADQPKQKAWSQLSTSGKVARGTARTTNLGVILIGGVFTCVLAYALATELFARNSPTKLYEDARQKLIASPEIARYLKPPLKFHTNAPSLNAPRHRNRHVSSQVAVDSAGREHLLMHFYIESVQPNSASAIEPPPSLSDVTWDSAYEWGKNRVNDIMDSSKKAFAYVVGVNTPPPPTQNSRSASSGANPSPGRQTEIGKPSKEGSSAWSFAGLFSGLKSSSSSASTDNVAIYAGEGWTEGEVHADLVKDENGDFQYRYLLVDIPHSRTRKPLRIYVEKGKGFREGEGVFTWG